MFYSDIRKARPNLSIAAPLTFWLCIGYVGLNLALGYIIYSIKDQSSLVVYSLIPQQIMAGLFSLTAIVCFISLVLNAWSGIRLTLGFSLFLKSLYAYSLVDLGLRIGFESINGIMSLWLFITYVQFCMIVFFAPPQLNGKTK